MFRPVLEIGGIYKFDFFLNKEYKELWFFKTEKDAMLQKAYKVVGASTDFKNKIFTVVSNTPYFETWMEEQSVVGILIDEKILYFKMNNKKVSRFTFGIEEVYDLELSLNWLAFDRTSDK